MFKTLQNTTLIFGQAHQLTLCWTDDYKTFSTFRVGLWQFISYLQTRCEIIKSNWETQNKHPVLLMLPSKPCPLLRHRKFLSLYKRPSYPFLFFNISSSLIDFMFFTRQYAWRNSKTNGQIRSNILIRCKHRYQHAACCFEHRFA